MQPDNNGLIIKDISGKLDGMSNETLKALGLTKEGLLKQQERENAAIIACGALLGNCHLMAETVDWILDEIVGKDEKGKTIKRRQWFLMQPWCRQEIKVGIKKGIESLSAIIKTSRRNSMSDPDYMNEVADNMYKELKPDLFKLYNGILLELGKVSFSKPFDKGGVAYLILITILIKWIAYYYDDAVAYMKKKYASANYDSWFGQARCDVPLKWWTQAVESYFKLYCNDVFNVSESGLITNGIRVIDNKMRSAEVAGKVTEDAGEKVNEDLIDQSFRLLGIGNDNNIN